MPVPVLILDLRRLHPELQPGQLGVEAALRLFQVHAVTEGTDAQAQVSVRLEEDGRIATGQAADTDTLTASAKAYVNALNNLMARKEKGRPEAAIASGF